MQGVLGSRRRFREGKSCREMEEGRRQLPRLSEDRLAEYRESATPMTRCPLIQA